MPKVGGRRVLFLQNRKKLEAINKLINKHKNSFQKLSYSKLENALKHLKIQKCFYPNTAMKLQDSNKMAIKSYLKAAHYYAVSHLVALQQSKDKNYIRLIKVKGGQMIFKVLNYCRMRQVLIMGGHPYNQTLMHPIVILNNFNQSQQSKSMAHYIQQMFPPLNLTQIKTNLLKRVLSFTYKSQKKMIYFRHYRIQIRQGGTESKFNDLMNKKSIDLSQYHTIQEYFLNQKSLVHGHDDQQIVKLKEIGPRLKLKFLLFKENSGVVEENNNEQAQK